MISPADERLMRWLEEAAGYKIRHVPSSFPDVLKTEDVIAFEYEHFIALSPQKRIEITRSRLDYLRRPETDMEAATAMHVIASFARGQGRWQGLPVEVRRAQLEAPHRRSARSCIRASAGSSMTGGSSIRRRSPSTGRSGARSISGRRFWCCSRATTSGR